MTGTPSSKKRVFCPNRLHCDPANEFSHRAVPAMQVRLLLRRLLAALQFLHDREIVHRDVKVRLFAATPITTAAAAAICVVSCPVDVSPEDCDARLFCSLSGGFRRSLEGAFSPPERSSV